MDVDVGLKQSDEVVVMMLGFGIDVECERVRGAAHYLASGAGGNIEAMLAFIKKYLQYLRDST